MLRRILIAGALCSGLSVVPAAAGSKMSWKTFKARVEADCQAFRDSILASPGAERMPEPKRYPPRYPNGVRTIPLVCVGLSYDVLPDGRTDNIAVVFKSPVDADEEFEEEAIAAVRKWRYEAPRDEGSEIVGLKTAITFEFTP